MLLGARYRPRRWATGRGFETGPVRAYAAVSLALLLAACGGGGGGAGDTTTPQPASPPAPPPAPPPVNPTFVDATGLSNINYTYGVSRRDYSGGTAEEQSDAEQVAEIAIGGAATGDYDGDGFIDVFIARGDLEPNLLYRNIGGLMFEEVAATAGVAYTKSTSENYAHSGPIFADMDGDGHLDLFLGGLFDDPSKIFRNNGDGTFTDVTAGAGIDTLRARYTVSAAFGDYDLDGRLDLFVSHWGTPRDRLNPGDTQNLWRNVSANGVIEFESVSIPAGISPSIITLPDPRREDAGDNEDTFTPTSHVSTTISIPTF
jgi:hypothetical protein